MSEPSRLMYFDKKLMALILIGPCPKCHGQIELKLCVHCVEKILRGDVNGKLRGKLKNELLA